jgi:threonine dehydrogenase-like Zn-dependent dehydrogenase
MNGWDGCFADRFKLPIRNLVEVPREVHDDQAVFTHPLAAAAHAANLIRVEGKPYVTVLGDGVAALLCAQVLARLNASVRLLGAQPGKFTLAERWGIKHRHASEVGRRADQDIVVDASGSGSGLDLAMQLVRPRGKVVLAPPIEGAAAAIGAEALRLLAEREVELLGARGGNPADAVALLAQGVVDVLPLITSRRRLADGAAALAHGPEQVRVVMEP